MYNHKLEWGIREAERLVRSVRLDKNLSALGKAVQLKESLRIFSWTGEAREYIEEEMKHMDFLWKYENYIKKIREMYLQN